MTSSSSSSSPPSSSLQTSSSSFNLPPTPSFRKSTSTKLAYLYEVNLLDDTQKISETDLPLVNPYHAFVKKSPSVIRSIKTLIKQPSRITKEYVQASSFDQHKIPATSENRKFDYLVEYTPPSWATQSKSYSLYVSTQTYDDPAYRNKLRTSSYTSQVQNPQGVDAEGRLNRLLKLKLFSIGKAKMHCSNSVLHRIESKVDLVQTNLKKMTVSVDSRILHLKNCVLKSNKGSPPFMSIYFSSFYCSRIDPQKEQEIHLSNIAQVSSERVGQSKPKPHHS
uniref:Uncharacterized protein n=1 Tax=Salix viminalis TaxID=40686 RepID=A0A6N2LTI5_SALVM